MMVMPYCLRKLAASTVVLGAVVAGWLDSASPALAQIPVKPAAGPLKVHPANPRYFTDGSGKAIYLTGAHTWPTLQDSYLAVGTTDPPPAFDYPGYLDFLQEHNHNFIRLWRLEPARWRRRNTDPFNYVTFQPWKRTGPGNALDGKPKFDLNQLDPAYFNRLRERVIAARDRGVYVSIMLFEGLVRKPLYWEGCPFNGGNNVNGINGDTNGNGRGMESQTLQVPAITRLQEAYVRKVIDSVNDLDNVLYEIANESLGGAAANEWQYHLINFIRDYEARKPKQHPVGMTAGGDMTLDVLMKCPADWISPTSFSQVSTGAKVSLVDTDHIWGVGGDRVWAWETFLRGHNPIWMDPYDPKFHGSWNRVADFRDNLLLNLGYTAQYAKKVNLAEMAPHDALASTGYCLAKTGSEYLVYQPRSSRFDKWGRAIYDQTGSSTFTLDRSAGTYRYEWFNPATGAAAGSGTVKTPGGTESFTPPFDKDAVLYLKADSSAPSPPRSRK